MPCFYCSDIIISHDYRELIIRVLGTAIRTEVLTQTRGESFCVYCFCLMLHLRAFSQIFDNLKSDLIEDFLFRMEWR